MGGPTRGVLVVDNDPNVRGAIVRKLMGDGVPADIARSASDAIRLLDQAKYQVVLLDWDDDGALVVSHLRCASEERHERVMVMTSSELKSLRNLDRAFVRGVLFKPLDFIAVTAHVRAMLS
jgi:DNA-binding response OmpR family regulator